MCAMARLAWRVSVRNCLAAHQQRTASAHAPTACMGCRFLCPPCSICFEELDLSRKEFAGLSEQARAFITALLVKDPLQRPSAEEALRHPYLASGSKGVATERAAGAPLGRTVVSRIQVGG